MSSIQSVFTKVSYCLMYCVQARDRMYEMLDSVISRRRNGEDFQQDFLESLIMKHSRKSDTQEDENKLTDKQLKDNVLTLLVAGHDTTTAALTWLIKFLEENQNVLEQLRVSAYLN
jgi:cytochrome P450